MTWTACIRNSFTKLFPQMLFRMTCFILQFAHFEIRQYTGNEQQIIKRSTNSEQSIADYLAVTIEELNVITDTCIIHLTIDWLVKEYTPVL